MLAADLDALVGKIVGLFGTAEDQIAGAISSQLSAQLGDGGQDVGSAVLNQLGQQLAGALLEHAGGILGVRTAVESILRSVLGQLGSTLSAAFLGAVEGGADTAVAEASELRRAARHAKHGSHAIMPDAPSATARASKRDKLVQDLIRQFQPQLDRRLRLTHAQVLRSAEDIYRKAVAAGAMGATPGASGPDQLTRRQATQRTLDDLWQRGISGFVDARGRQWNLATYVEMATRTALAQASAQAHLDMMGVEGFDLCQVSDSPHECPKCRPWEGKVLTRDNSGAGGKTLTLDSELDGDPVEVEVAGSVSEAIAAGLLHPNCTHRFITYLAGLTRPLTNTQNAKGYEATQTQRGLEREARRIRVQIKGAVSPSHVKDLKAKLKGQSQAIEDHLAANPTLVRKPERELPNLGHVPSPVDPTKAPVKVAPVSKLKAVQVKKVAAPVKAKKAPVKKAPVKKATVTAPRKPAAKSTLAPKVRPPKSTPPRAVKAAAPTASAFAKRPTFDQPVLSEGELKSVYGPRMTVNRAGKDPARLAVQLRGLGQIDKGLHKRMNGFLGEEQYGGIYLGPKGILDTAPVEMRANFRGQPRGYPAGSTYNDVRGCYVPHEHALLIGDDQHPLDGTHSTAQHEFGHAVDHMEGHPSRSQEYKDVYDSLKSSITFKPYFSATGNPSGYHSESFAEFFNAYASQRGKPEQVMVRVMMGQLGFAPAANDIAYAVIKGPEEIARLPRGAREGLVAMRKLIAMLDDITEGKR